MMSTPTVRAGSTEVVKFRLLRNNLAFDATGYDEIIVKRRSKAGNVDTYSTDDPSPLVTIEPGSVDTVVLTPDDDTFWEDGSQHYVFYIRVERGSDVYIFPTSSYEIVQVIDAF